MTNEQWVIRFPVGHVRRPSSLGRDPEGVTRRREDAKKSRVPSVHRNVTPPTMGFLDWESGPQNAHGTSPRRTPGSMVEQAETCALVSDSGLRLVQGWVTRRHEGTNSEPVRYRGVFPNSKGPVEAAMNRGAET